MRTSPRPWPPPPSTRGDRETSDRQLRPPVSDRLACAAATSSRSNGHSTHGPPLDPGWAGGGGGGEENQNSTGMVQAGAHTEGEKKPCCRRSRSTDQEF